MTADSSSGSPAEGGSGRLASPPAGGGLPAGGGEERPADQIMAGLVEITAGLVEIIRDETGLSPAAVTADMPLVGNPEIDRLSLMTIVTLAEDRFKVEIPDAEIPGLITVGFAAELIVNLSSGRCG